MTTFLQDRSGLIAGVSRSRLRDWPALAQQLLDEFPEATISEVVHVVREARDAVESADDSDPLGTGEAIARNQLRLITGHGGPVARLDAQTHTSR